jgi:hypothetical protein
MEYPNTSSANVGGRLRERATRIELAFSAWERGSGGWRRTSANNTCRSTNARNRRRTPANGDGRGMFAGWGGVRNGISRVDVTRVELAPASHVDRTVRRNAVSTRSSQLHSSNTSKSSTTASADIRRLACSHQSSSRLGTNQRPWPENPTTRAPRNPGAPQCRSQPRGRRGRRSRAARARRRVKGTHCSSSVSRMRSSPGRCRCCRVIRGVIGSAQSRSPGRRE